MSSDVIVAHMAQVQKGANGCGIWVQGYGFGNPHPYLWGDD